MRNIVDFFRNPMGYMGAKFIHRWESFYNLLKEIFNNNEFDPTKFEKQKPNPVICIDQTNFETMKENLEQIVDTNVARFR